ncbi:MAG: hypothetical protein U0232_13980 [Thermomicrobiales bacterium]
MLLIAQSPTCIHPAMQDTNNDYCVVRGTVIDDVLPRKGARQIVSKIDVDDQEPGFRQVVSAYCRIAALSSFLLICPILAACGRIASKSSCTPRGEEDGAAMGGHRFPGVARLEFSIDVAGNHLGDQEFRRQRPCTASIRPEHTRQQ